MKRLGKIISIAVLLIAAPAAAEAKGCIKGAIVGGVAGHYVHRHGVIGAIAGCVIGRHEARKREYERTHPQ